MAIEIELNYDAMTLDFQACQIVVESLPHGAPIRIDGMEGKVGDWLILYPSGEREILPLGVWVRRGPWSEARLSPAPDPEPQDLVAK
ncbi:MAG: hypothetical protein A2Y72_03345 [Chloroflexi bacterium RBG_13_53_26]|nr:MAG: hypothetical protein A2Y72_03345 [Chloroflexi bacterium RBG_13_53_26]